MSVDATSRRPLAHELRLAADRHLLYSDDPNALDDLMRAAADEIDRLNAWVFCPEHGPFCDGARCCCADKHEPRRAIGGDT